MSGYYQAQRQKNLFDPQAKTLFKLSRSRLDGFLKCPRCFYLDRRLGVDQPPGFPFSLNSAVDKLLKKEFDLYRAKGEAHPLMAAAGLEAVPFAHPKLEEWRNNFQGITYPLPGTTFLVTGAIDDLWQNRASELLVVDYKATAKDGEVNLDADWQIGYKRQVEIYQWLFRANGFKVAKTAFFVYCNGRANHELFGGRLEFDIKLLAYEGDDSWVEGALRAAYACLCADQLPPVNPDCDFCNYRAAVARAEKALPGSLII
jgi:hypothetical protein